MKMKKIWKADIEKMLSRIQCYFLCMCLGVCNSLIIGKNVYLSHDIEIIKMFKNWFLNELFFYCKL